MLTHACTTTLGLIFGSGLGWGEAIVLALLGVLMVFAVMMGAAIYLVAGAPSA